MIRREEDRDTIDERHATFAELAFVAEDLRNRGHSRSPDTSAVKVTCEYSVACGEGVHSSRGCVVGHEF